MQRRLHGGGRRCDEERRVEVLKLGVERPRAFGVARARRVVHLFHPLAREVRRHGDPTRAADLGERAQQVVVTGQEREVRLLDDRPRRVHVRVRLLDADDVVDLRQLDQQIRLDVDDGPARDVVEQHRRVAGGLGAGLEVRADSPARWACCSRA